MDTRRGRGILPPLRAQAETAAKEARLPGWTSGPADAFRHIVASAEATRRYGSGAAWTLGELNEQKGNWFDKQSQDDLDMDRHNNGIGRRIGATAKSFEEVVERAKAAIDEGAVRGGNGKENTSEEATPKWLSEERWREDGTTRDRSNWPPIWREGRDADAERVMTRPVADWTQDDVRKVQNARVYWRGDGPARDIAFGKVRQWYEEQDGRSSKPGGSISVHAYTRGDGSRVAAHSRAAPLRGGVWR